MKTAATVEIALDYPVTIDGTEVSVLHMRRPKVADTFLAQKSTKPDAEKELDLFANLCEVSPADIQKLDMMDYLKLQEQYGNFMAPEPQPPTNSEGSAQK